MPAENYYCPDNFFKKMTDLESPKKNNDCYFYYYSTCAKGDSCTFRHEPSALGCETMCSFWKEGKCLNVHCNFRHMELRKNRKVIPCYWESQPVGCLKAHCPFLHQNPRPSDEMSVEKSNIAAEKSNNDTESSDRKVTAVDSLVVNFEEESDTESMPAYSPLKNGGRRVKIKSLEEIKLEKIQAESAAFYAYSGQLPDTQSSNNDSDDLRQRIVRRIISKRQSPQRTVTVSTYPNEKINTTKRLSNDELANILGDESLRKKQKIVHHKDDGTYQVTFNKSVPENLRNVLCHESQNPKNDLKVHNIKIKTLAEIRAERNARTQGFSDYRKNITVEQEEAEVSSTSADENIQRDLTEDKSQSPSSGLPKRKIKLRRKLNLIEGNVESSDRKEENSVSSNELKDYLETSPTVHHQTLEGRFSEPTNSKNLKKQASSDSEKMEEDVLLLDDDEEDYDDVALKPEDELLKEISSFIDN